ncbi:MAG: hypothetical protein WCL18_09995 [bacterium]
MLKTVTEATKYIVDTVKESDSEQVLDENIVSGIIEDLLLEKLEDIISPEDVQEIVAHADDEEYISSYTQNKIPNYYTILNDIVKEVLTDYITETE